MPLLNDPEGDTCDDDDSDSSNGTTVLTQTPSSAAATCPGGSVPVWADCLGTPETGGDAWPPDITRNGTISAGDVFAIFPSWLTSTARYDLDASGSVSSGDVFMVFPWWLSGWN